MYVVKLLSETSRSDTYLGGQNGSYQFSQVGIELEGCVTYPALCWFALGPYKAEDLPENISVTTNAWDAMTTVTTAGNFTMISNTAVPATTHRPTRPPDAWEKLSTPEQA